MSPPRKATPPAFSARDFRASLGMFATGVTIVTARAGKDLISSLVSGLLTINPAALTITANNATRLYGAGNPAFAASFTGGLDRGPLASVAACSSVRARCMAVLRVGRSRSCAAQCRRAHPRLRHRSLACGRGAASPTPSRATRGS